MSEKVWIDLGVYNLALWIDMRRRRFVLTRANPLTTLSSDILVRVNDLGFRLVPERLFVYELPFHRHPGREAFEHVFDRAVIRGMRQTRILPDWRNFPGDRRLAAQWLWAIDKPGIGKAAWYSLTECANAKLVRDDTPLEPVFEDGLLLATPPGLSEDEKRVILAAVSGLETDRSRREDAGEKVGGARKDTVDWVRALVSETLGDFRKKHDSGEALRMDVVLDTLRDVDRDKLLSGFDVSTQLRHGRHPFIAELIHRIRLASVRTLSEYVWRQCRYAGARSRHRLKDYKLSEMERGIGKTIDSVAERYVVGLRSLRSLLERGAAGDFEALGDVFRKWMPEHADMLSDRFRKRYDVSESGYDLLMNVTCQIFEEASQSDIQRDRISRCLRSLDRDGEKDPGKLIAFVVAASQTDEDIRAGCRQIETRRRSDRDAHRKASREQEVTEIAFERKGPSRRGGMNVTEAALMNRFGLRAIEYGNYTSQNERQILLNEAYDSLDDLADLLGIENRQIGFDGFLALALGARGRGGRSVAHYEPDKRVINLAKGRGRRRASEWAGVGALAHEWAHALDHYVSCRVSSSGIVLSTKEMVSGNDQYLGVMPDGVGAFERAAYAIRNFVDACVFRSVMAKSVLDESENEALRDDQVRICLDDAFPFRLDEARFDKLWGHPIFYAERYLWGIEALIGRPAAEIADDMVEALAVELENDAHIVANTPKSAVKRWFQYVNDVSPASAHRVALFMVDMNADKMATYVKTLRDSPLFDALAKFSEASEWLRVSLRPRGRNRYVFDHTACCRWLCEKARTVGFSDDDVERFEGVLSLSFGALCDTMRKIAAVNDPFSNGHHVRTQFYLDAMALDRGGRRYWRTASELFARAFESCIGKLMWDQGIVNPLLAEVPSDHDRRRLRGIELTLATRRLANDLVPTVRETLNAAARQKRKRTNDPEPILSVSA